MNYDQINKVKEKHKKEIDELNKKIKSLEDKVSSLEEKNNSLRKQMHDEEIGTGAVNKLKKENTALKRDKETLKNILKDSDKVGKMVKEFTKERQDLIKKIGKISFSNSIFNALAIKFKDGLDNVLELAYRIKMNHIDDMDYFTFVFRDNIVGLLEKMLGAVLDKREDSASKYLAKLASGAYVFPSDYLKRVPLLNDKKVVNNVLALINLQSTGYHGTKFAYKRIIIDRDTNEPMKPDKFLNVNKEDQLNAIFTLLAFMHDVFTNKDAETNLLMISSSWFKSL